MRKFLHGVFGGSENNDPELENWFETNKNLLESAYTSEVAQQPWQQSGFGLRTPRSAEDWEALRRPIANCVNRSGDFLDIGCANGYLLECLLKWVGERDISLVPYGLDFSKKMIELSQERLPQYADNFYVGNAFDWEPPQWFDFVRAELVYMPEVYYRAFINRLLSRFLKPGGRLLLADYRGKSYSGDATWIDEYLDEQGYAVADVQHGFLGGEEMARIAVIQV